MHLVVQPTGDVACIYDELLDLAALGQLQIRRASHVEPNEQGEWLADMSPVAGPMLGPFANRSQALAAERAWLDEHWLANRS
jgi:hypothetical protein